MKSIHRWLLGTLIFGLSLASLVAAFDIFHTARHEAGELFDYELRTVALSLPAEIETAAVAEQPTRGYTGIADDRIVIEIWGRSGSRIYHSSSEPELPLPTEDGFSAITTPGVTWRAFKATQTNRIVVVAQPYSIRHALGFRLAWRTLWPLMLFVPLCMLLVLYVVRQGLLPINRLSERLHERSVRSLSALSVDGVPEELRPLVIALNALLKRLEESTHAQQNFVADAAHELRTPLTALKLQLQAASSRVREAEGYVRVPTIQNDQALISGLESRVNRIIHLAQQLLVMAREDAQLATALKPVSLRRVAEQVVADCSLLAEVQRVDLGLESDDLAETDMCLVVGDASALGTLMNNLIDNAIRHTEAGGRIDVTLSRGEGVMNLEVTDTGTGIPDVDLPRVLNRFFRGETARGQGSGLGLAIAASVAARHGATLTLRNRETLVPGAGSGLVASVRGLKTPPV